MLVWISQTIITSPLAAIVSVMLFLLRGCWLILLSAAATTTETATRITSSSSSKTTLPNNNNMNSDTHNKYNNNTIHDVHENATSFVPFIVILQQASYEQQQQWNDLYRALDQYDIDATNMLQSLSQASEVALFSEAEWGRGGGGGRHPQQQQPGVRRLLLLSDRIQHRIHVLAKLLEQDAKILRKQLLRPFPIVRVLPSPTTTATDTTNGYSINNKTTVNNNSTVQIPPKHQKYGPAYMIRSTKNMNKSSSSSSSSSFANTTESSSSSSSSYNSAYQVLAHIVRDWTHLGIPLRKSLYAWCIQQVQLYHPLLQPKPQPQATTSPPPTTTSSTTNTNRTMTCHPQHSIPLPQLPLSILIPGAGLGRLAYELYKLGYSVQANEASLVMAAAAHAIFHHPTTCCTDDDDDDDDDVHDEDDSEQNDDGNDKGDDDERDDLQQKRRKRRRVDGKCVIHPFLLDAMTNEVHSDRRYDAVSFPDEIPNVAAATTTTLAIHGKGSLSYTIGDFVDTYHVTATTTTTAYHAIITCFFIDTATNIYEYISLIHDLLHVPSSLSSSTSNQSSSSSSHGIWINVGPLQWHRNSMLRVSADELRDMLDMMGFEILHWSVDRVPLEYRQQEEEEDLRGDNNNDCENTYHNRRSGANSCNGQRKMGEDDDATHKNGFEPRWTNYDAYRPLRFVARRR